MMLRYLRCSRITSSIRQPNKNAFVRLLTTEAPPATEHLIDPLDKHIGKSIRRLLPQRPVPVSILYEQYRARSGWIRDDLILVSEERPATGRRVEFDGNDSVLAGEAETQGDGTVLIVHALLKPHSNLRSSDNTSQDGQHPEDIVEKLAICSGFILNTRSASVTAVSAAETPEDGAVVLTCAHTLEEVSSSFDIARGTPETETCSSLSDASIPHAFA